MTKLQHKRVRKAVSIVGFVLITTLAAQAHAAFIDSGKSTARVPAEITSIVDFVQKAVGAYSTTKDALRVLQALGAVTGLMSSSPSGDDLIRSLQAHLDQAIGNLEWKIDAQFAATRYAQVAGALINAKQSRDRGMPLNSSWAGWQNSIDAVIAAAQPALFLRQHVPSAISGRWMDIISDRPEVTRNGLIYDWRIAIPALLQLVALRLQIIAVIDPDFRTEVVPGTRSTSVYAEELMGIRQHLLDHYDKIKSNIRCGRKTIDFIEYKACADINTGILAVDVAWCPPAHCTTPSYGDIEQQTPLFQLRAIADALALYSDPSFRDLTDPHHVIRLDDDGSCLGDSGSFEAPGLGDCHSVTARWTYDRQTGLIRSDYLVYPACLGAFFVDGYPIFTAANDYDPNWYVLKWTYDPLSRTVMHASGYFLSWTNWQTTDPYTASVVYRAGAVSSTPLRWGSSLGTHCFPRGPIAPDQSTPGLTLTLEGGQPCDDGEETP